MELEDFKQDWNSKVKDSIQEYNLNEILVQKVQGPLRTLKIRYIRQVVLLPLATIMISITNFTSPELRNNPMVWIIVPVLCLLTFLYYRNYLIIKKMEEPLIKNVKDNLKNQLNILDNNGKTAVKYVRRIFILFIIALELSMANNILPAYDSWKNVELFFRIGAYIFFILIQPYITNYFYKQNFGQYIDRLKNLVRQTS